MTLVLYMPAYQQMPGRKTDEIKLVYFTKREFIIRPVC